MTELEKTRDITLGSTILDIFVILTRYRKFLFLFILIVTITTTTIALLSPKWYKSTASVFPAEQTDLSTSLDGMSSIMKTFASGKKFSALAGPTDTDRYIAILKSNAVLSNVIKKFDLVNVYKIKSYPNENTVKELLSNLEIEIQDEGNLTITVYDKSPQRAADMANYFIELLNKVNSELLVQNAKGNREFIENRYNKNISEIKILEEKMKAFQKKYGIIAVPEQLNASIKANAEIYGKLASKEIELGILRKKYTEEHPLIRATIFEIDELKKKLSKINTNNYNYNDLNILIPLKLAPEIITEYYSIYRDLEIQYKILQFITPLYEQAKVEEKRNTPSVIVLDRAEIPERKAKPKILFYTLLSFVISSIISLIGIFSYEGWKKLRYVDHEKYEYIENTIKRNLNIFYIKEKFYNRK